MSIPQTLPNISTSADSYSSLLEYKHRSSITGYEIYDLWSSSHQNWYGVVSGFSNALAYSIKVDTSTGVWSDNASTTDPLVDASNANYVILNVLSGGNYFEVYRFTKPSLSGSGSSGSGSSGGSSTNKKCHCNFW